MDGEPAVALSPKRYGSMALLRGHGRLPTPVIRPKLGATSRSFVAEFVTPVEGTTLLRMVLWTGSRHFYGYASASENSGYRVVMKEGIQQSLWNAEIAELNQIIDNFNVARCAK